MFTRSSPCALRSSDETRQQNTVRGERDVVDLRNVVQHPDQVGQAAPHQGLAPGDSDLGDAHLHGRRTKNAMSS